MSGGFQDQGLGIDSQLYKYKNNTISQKHQRKNLPKTFAQYCR